MINVGFTLLGGDSWFAGVNYLRNLLFAISALEERQIRPILFAGEKVSDKTTRLFEPYAAIVRNSLLDENSRAYFLRKLIFKATGEDLLFSRLLARHGIVVASHSNICGRRLPFKTINWIPDFQHLHLPAMYSAREIRRIDSRFRPRAEKSDVILLSSFDAFDDFRRYAPGHEGKGRVLQFVSQPNPRIFEMNERGAVERKYGISDKYFYLPNQFWKHKNHRVVFEAVDILKRRGREILLVCTGHTADYRNRGHFEELASFIADRGLGGNIRILGLIDYDDVLYFMRHAVSVINPSHFEGWSSTVEEAKSIGKNMILSNIRVHREQDPPGSVYFSPEDPEKLAEILGRTWDERAGGLDVKLERAARESLPARTRQFAVKYQDIVLEFAGADLPPWRREP